MVTARRRGSPRDTVWVICLLEYTRRQDDIAKALQVIDIDASLVRQLLRAGESLTVEFKSDRQRQLSDRELYEAVVCLANAQGGTILIGVEDDGRPTGAQPRHGQTTDPFRLQAAIFNNTEPPINTRVTVIPYERVNVIAVQVDRYPQVCATKTGVCVRRVMGAQEPECRPYYPSQHASHYIDLGLLDYSAQAIPGASVDDFDPLEMERLRRMVRHLGGDHPLQQLGDTELAQALGLVESRDGRPVPTVAGLLLLGREAALRRALPTHEIAFQVLGASGRVEVNRFFHGALLGALEEIQMLFAARNREQEVQVGLLRVALPDFSPEAFREAIMNAVVHRDYARMGTVHIQMHSDHLFISNPGGFPEGINLDNLLVHEPKPRNPRLAECLVRIGLVEKTGRGIDKIFLGQLRYGRPAPDYGQSNSEGVRLIIPGGAASLEFVKLVHEADRSGSPLGLDELLVLNLLQIERRVDATEVGRITQKGGWQARGMLERLVERGLVEGRGERRGRIYTLSASLYRQLGRATGYIRTRGFDPVRQQAMVLEYLRAHGRITRREIVELCGVTSNQARWLLTRLVRKGEIKMAGEPRRGAYYELPPERRG